MLLPASATLPQQQQARRVQQPRLSIAPAPSCRSSSSITCSAGGGAHHRRRHAPPTALSLAQGRVGLEHHSSDEALTEEDLAAPQTRRRWQARRLFPLRNAPTAADLHCELLEAQRHLLARILESKPPDSFADAPLSAVRGASPPSADVDGGACATSSATITQLQLEELPAEKDSEETCSVEHPGTICCTSVTVERDPAAMNVKMQLMTTVRLTNPHSPTTLSNVTLSDLEQLGCMAAVGHLHQQATRLGARNGSVTVQERHEAVLRVLSHGRVVSADKQTNQFGHVTFKVELEDPDTHQKMRAFVKPCVEDHGHGWHRAEVEAVAYRLNRLLGMDYVPPCAFRKQIDVDWTHFEHGGVFMYWAEHGRELRCAPMDQWGVPSDVVLSDARILDVLLQNSDRHHGHFLLAEHWAQGGGARSAADAGWRGATMPVFIDHAAGFRSEAFVHMKHENAFNTGATTRVSARTFLRLRCLDRLAVSQALGDLLAPAEVDQVMRRREDILAYLDALVAERGYEQVVVEDHQAWCGQHQHQRHH